MDLRGLVVGAGNVAQGYRATEVALRQAEEERLTLQKLRLEQAEREREEQFRRTMPPSQLGDTALLSGAPLPSRPEFRLPLAAPLPSPRVITPPAAPAAGVAMPSQQAAADLEANVVYPPVGRGKPPVPTPVAVATQSLRELEDRKVQLLRDLRNASGGGQGRAPIQAQIDDVNRQIAAAQSRVTRESRATGVTGMRGGAPATPTAPAAAQPAAAQPAAAQPAAPAVAPAAQQYDSSKTQYDALMQEAAQANGINPVVFKRLIGTESSFNPNAVSPRGAEFGLGIAQIAAVHGLSDERRRDPNVAIPFAAQLFKRYLDAAGGDYNQAILRYKGASSLTGVQAMAPVAQAILAGITPAAAAPAVAAPAAAATPAAAAGAPAAEALGPVATVLQVAPGVREMESDAGVMRYYAVDSGKLTADQRYLDEDYNTQRGIAVDDYTAQKGNLDATYQSVRRQLVAEYNTRFDAGQARQAQEVVARIQQLDEQYRSGVAQLGTTTRTALATLDSKYKLGRLALATFAAAAQLENQNNPTAAAQMMSYLYGQPIQYRLTSDGRFDMLLPGTNGQLQVRGTFDRGQILDALKAAGIAAYRDARAAMAEKTALERLKTEGEVTREQARMIRELAVKALDGQIETAKITLQGEQYDIKADGSGNVIIYTKNGKRVGIIDPRVNQTEEGPGGGKIALPPLIRWMAPR